MMKSSVLNARVHDVHHDDMPLLARYDMDHLALPVRFEVCAVPLSIPRIAMASLCLSRSGHILHVRLLR
jgi:hypothetical protein